VSVLVGRRDVLSVVTDWDSALQGTLASVMLLPDSPLVVLQGGGTSPLYPPNKAIVFHDGMGLPVAELEFG
jgi:hypothetical protein